jgi:hypothetical protein
MFVGWGRWLRTPAARTQELSAFCYRIALVSVERCGFPGILAAVGGYFEVVWVAQTRAHLLPGRFDLLVVPALCGFWQL